MDGCSTDGTLEVLKTYPHLKVVSEPDKGLYDALNKGITCAKGEIIGFLNTDDFYEPGIFAGVVALFDDYQNIDAVVGEARIVASDANGNFTTVRHHLAVTQHDLLERAALRSPSINAYFFRRTIVEKVGFFDLRYRLGADREWLLRFWLAGGKIHTLYNKLIYNYRMHSESLTFNADFMLKRSARGMLEGLLIAEQYLSKADIPEALRRMCQDLHTIKSFEVMQVSIYSKDVNLFFQTFIRLWRANPLWFWTILPRGWGKIKKEFVKITSPNP